MLEEVTLGPLVGTWDVALLQPIAEINQRMLEGLCQAALVTANGALAGANVAGSAGGVGAVGAFDTGATEERRPPRLVLLLGEEWCRLDTVAQQRLAGCPYLLVDAGFGQSTRWDRPLTPAVRDSASRNPYFQGPDGIALVRRTLMFAWHLARSNRLGARVLLGMCARSAERIADCRLQDLDALAETAPPWITPRWEQQPMIWRQLIQAAHEGSAAQLRLAQLRGLQLIAAACTGPGT